MDLDAVRTFVVAADAGQFEEAAAALSITQQAVSQRVAGLEKDLDVRLFTRTARGAQLTIDGQVLPAPCPRASPGRRTGRCLRPSRPARGEVADYYAELATTFGLTIDMLGPVFGNEARLDEIADSSDLATLVGERSRYLWPDNYDLRRVAIRDPTPVYPMSLIWRDDNTHPALNKFRAYLDSRRADIPDTNVWTPKWGQRSTATLIQCPQWMDVAD